MKEVRVGINGFGRIGRILFRAGAKRLKIVGINDLGGPQSMAHLLKYDSTHGTYQGHVEAGENHLTVDGEKIPVSQSKDPREIPWKDWGCDIVLECTGRFKEAEELQWHLDAGAKKVLVSAPAPGVDLTVVFGINHEIYNPEKHNFLSNASCTTNCLAPMAKVLHDQFGIERGLMTTVHSYTNDQMILDASHKDLRRARAAALSMIPTTTGAAKAVGKVLPELAGKIDGLAVRVPTPNVSLVDFVFESKNELAVDSIHQAIREASQGFLKGILSYTDEPLVSTDFNGNPHSSVVDFGNTMVIEKNMAKVFSWYDNEMGFSHRMVDLAEYLAEKGL